MIELITKLGFLPDELVEVLNDTENAIPLIDLVDVYSRLRDVQSTMERLDCELKENDTYKSLVATQKRHQELMEKAKTMSKELLVDGSYTSSGFCFKKSTNKKTTRKWYLDLIRKEKWAPAVIIEAVDEKVFKALEKTIDYPEQYYTEEYSPYTVYKMLENE